MGAFLLRRIVFSIVAVWAVATIVFAMLYASGDPITIIQAGAFGSAEYFDELRHDLGYDLPLVEQYLRFVGNASQGDLGRSLFWTQPALPLVLERLPATLELALAAMAFATIVAVPGGILAAIRPGSVISRLVMLVSYIGQCMPLYWLGIMLVLVFAVQLRLLPVAGRDGPASLVLPAITLGLFPMARIARLTRTSMMDVMVQNYIVTARSKGLRESTVLGRHALRNAAIPIVTIMGLQLGAMLGGAVITETIFAWPGVGSLCIQAIFNRDLPLVQAVVIVVSVLFIAINLVVDITYAYIDPRIRYG